jgi:L-alanine-DL-glutamate epimerase-like enolase superfamily enzyme
MISLRHQVIALQKRVPLAISRGTQSASSMVWIRLEALGVEGWGEAGEFSVGPVRQGIEGILADLARAATALASASPCHRDRIERVLLGLGLGGPARSGITQALLDWHGRRLGEPVWRLLGLSPTEGPVTSVTIGISDPESAVRRLRQWLEVGEIRAVKVKLGSPAGPDADRRMFQAVHDAAPPGLLFSVDANGGWEPADAIAMSRWLADRGVDHIEQPLARGREKELAVVRRDSALPLVLDESCFTSGDIPSLAGLAAGINIKLMKCGGVPEAQRMIATARAHGLKVMLGCYGSSALANTAAAHLGPLVDYLDLDSHLNLLDDPFQGARFEAGRLVLPESPGFGVTHVASH